MRSMDLAQIYARADQRMVYVRTDKNGTKIYHDYTCKRCGGAGGAQQWIYTGFTCYECGGSGRSVKPTVIKKYTPEYEAKLAEQRAKRAEKAKAKRIEEIKAELPKKLELRGFNAEGKIYLVTGDTYQIKDELREAGAHFKQHLNGWTFTEPSTEYPTVEISWEEVLFINYETGYLNWKEDIADTIQSKLLKEEKVVSEYVGTIGAKLDTEVTFVREYSYERKSFSGFGTEWVSIYKFVDDNGNILIWNTTAYLRLEQGNKYRLTGTVAEHKEYAGDKQTALKRCKVKEVA